MPEVSTYTFAHKELLELLIRASGVRDGKWMLQVSFGFTAGNFGPDDDNINPGAITILNHVAITRAPQDAPKGLVLDAARLSPSST